MCTAATYKTKDFYFGIMNFHTVTKLQLLHEIFRLSSAI